MRISQKNVYCRRTQSDPKTAPKRAKTPSCLIRKKLRNRFPKSARILKRKEFLALGKNSERFVGDQLFIQYQESSTPKLGITTVRKFGNAIKRNAFKRSVREAFRLTFSSLPPCKMVIFPKKGLETFSFQKISEDLKEFSLEYIERCATKSS